MSELEHFGTPCDVPELVINGICSICEEDIQGNLYECDCGQVICGDCARHRSYHDYNGCSTCALHNRI